MQPEVAVSRHKCLIYEGHPSEQLPVVVPLLADGLRDNWRCLYLGSPESVDLVGAALAGSGVDTRRQTDRGALVLSSDRSHLVDGRFDARAMVDGLRSSVDLAVKDGFGGLCATGDMRWELGDDDNFGVLVEYEARLEQVFRDVPLRGICQYRRDLLPANAVRDALLTHRSAYVGAALEADNLFYTPPELLLEARDGAKYGEWMCQQILRVMDAESARDRVMAALRESEATQRRLAEQLAEANRDLERRVAERTAELQVANRHLEAFSYSVSHDLRAPLRAIEGFGRMVVEDCGDELDGQARAHLDRVLVNARRMGELIEGMLALGRVTRASLRREPLDLSAVAGRVVRELAEGDPARSVAIVVQPGLRAAGDAVLLQAALTNLLSNAWKFTSKTAAARIEVGRDAAAGAFFVRDNGAGFDMAYAQRLFGAFQRLHAQADFPGTGVGLATVDRIVSRHGGRVWAESQPGEGATFFFTLPEAGASAPPHA